MAILTAVLSTEARFARELSVRTQAPTTQVTLLNESPAITKGHLLENMAVLDFVAVLLAGNTGLRLVLLAIGNAVRRLLFF